jgi:hypothetical protein
MRHSRESNEQYQARIYPKGSGEAVLATVSVEPDCLLVYAGGKPEAVSVPIDDCDIKLGSTADRVVFVWRSTGDTIIADAAIADSLKNYGKAPGDVAQYKSKLLMGNITNNLWIAGRFAVVGLVIFMFVSCCAVGFLSGSHKHNGDSSEQKETAGNQSTDSSQSGEQSEGGADQPKGEAYKKSH